MTAQKNEPYIFSGFTSPRYTQIPDIVFDELAPILSGAEYKVLMYILRRTFGFKKDSDAISYNQILKGIVKRDGTRLDYGAGVKSPASVSKAIKKLEELKIISVERRETSKGELESTVYHPNMGGYKGTSKNEVPPTSKNEVPPTSKNEVTRNSNYKKQTTTRNRNGEAPEGVTSKNGAGAPVQVSPVVVSLLIKQGVGKNQISGIAQAASKKIAEREDELSLESYVNEKIAYRDFELENNPQNVKKKTAWLIAALKFDYSKPDGFKSGAEIAAEKATKQEEIAAAERQHAEYEAEQKRLKAERETQIKRIEEAKERAFKNHGTSEQDQYQWERSVEYAYHSMPQHQRFNFGRILKNTHYLSDDRKKVYIFVEANERESAETVRPSLMRAVFQMERDFEVPRPKIVFLTENDF